MTVVVRPRNIIPPVFKHLDICTTWAMLGSDTETQRQKCLDSQLPVHQKSQMCKVLVGEGTKVGHIACVFTASWHATGLLLMMVESNLTLSPTLPLPVLCTVIIDQPKDLYIYSPGSWQRLIVVVY